MLEPVELEFRIKDADLEQGSQRIVNRIVNMDEEAARLIKRLEALEAKLRELAAQPAMPGFAEQMADIRTEIDQIGGSLGQMVDGAVTTRLNEVAEGMSNVADSAGNYTKNIEEGTKEALESMIKLRSDLLALGEDSGSSMIKGIDKEIDDLTKKLAEAGNSGKESTEALTEGFEKVTKSGNMASTIAGSLGKMMSGSLYLLAAQVVAGLAVAIYKAATELSDMEKAVKRVDKGFVDFFKNLNTERASVDMLFNTLRNAEEGTQSYEKAKNTIINQYGEYLRGLSDEIQTLRDVEGAYKAVSAAVIQSGRDRAMAASNKAAMDNYTKIESKNIEKIMEAFKKTSPDNYTQLIDELKRSIDNGEGFTQSVLAEIGKQYNFFGNPVRDAIQNIRKARTVLQEETSRINTLYSPPSPDNAEARKNFDYWNRELKQLEESRKALGSDEVGGEKWQELTKQIEAARKEVEKYSNAKAAPVRRDRTEEREFGQEQQRLRRIADLQRRIREQEISGELDTQAAVIATMEDGVEKELAQIALNYERRLSEVAKWGDELVRQQQEIERAIWENDNPDWQKQGKIFVPQTQTVAQLAPSQQRQIEDRAFLAEEEMTRATRDALQKRLAEYQSFEIKQREITKKYIDLRLALDKQYGNDRGKAYQEAIENINRIEQDEHDQLLLQNVETTEAFRKLNMVIEQEGRAALRERIRRLEEYLNVVADAAGKESEIYKQAYQDVKAARRELDENTIESYRQVADIMRMVSDNMSGAGSVFAKVAADIAQSAIQLYQAFQSGNKGSQVSGIISAILFVTESLRDVSYEGLAILDVLGDQRQIYDAIATSINVANERLKYQKILLDDLTGADLASGKFDLMDAQIQRQEEALERLKKLSIEYIDDQKEIFKDNVFGSHVENKGVGGFLVNLLTAGQAQTYTETILKGIDTSLLKTIDDWREFLYEIELNGGKIIDMPEGKRKEFEAYKEVMQNLVDNGKMTLLEMEQNIRFFENTFSKDIVEEDIEAIRLLIAEYDAAVEEYKRTMKELEQVFTGTTADAISQSIADGFFAGKRSAEDFADDFESLMKNAVRASFRINVTDMLAKDFYQQFVDATQSDFMLTADEIAALSDDFKQRIADASDQWKMFEDILAQAGIDMADAAQQKKDVGGFQTMSQETGSFLLGQFTAIRIHTGNIYDLISNMFLDYGAVAGYLAAIAQNTAATVTELKGVRVDFKRAKDEGFKIL